MEHLLKAPPYFQITLAVVVGIGILALLVALAVFKFFLPRLGKALLAPAPVETAGNTPPMMINPEFCTACEAEHQRSLRNETDIKEVKTKVDGLATSFHQGLIALGGEIGKMKNEIISALAAKN